jgi:hypothetical protein
VSRWRDVDRAITTVAIFFTGLGWPGGGREWAVFVGSALMLLSLYPFARARAEENK